MGYLNSFLELGAANLTTKNRNIQMPGGGDLEVTNNLIGALSLPSLSYFVFEVCSSCEMH